MPPSMQRPGQIPAFSCIGEFCIKCALFTSLTRDPKLVPLFERLQEEKKKIFLITNSPFETVDAGMTYMMGSQWRELFDVVVVQVYLVHLFHLSHSRSSFSGRKASLFHEPFPAIQRTGY